MRIKSVKSIGKKQTFNIEMSSPQHNYLLRPKAGQPIHKNSHAVAYSIVTYRCLWLKTHFPAEWWAAVMTECQQYKLGIYMSAAKLEGVKFGFLDCDDLSTEYSVKDGKVIPGLGAIKGIGEKAASEFTKIKGVFNSVDDFVSKCGKDKKVMERLIKLGAFDKLHPNRQGLWIWYQYKYCSGVDITALRRQIDSKLSWPEDKIQEQRERYAREFLASNPTKKKIPAKILNWKPKFGHKHDVPTYDQVVSLFSDFTPAERLNIEKELLGYYWSSPLDLYVLEGYTINDAKIHGVMEVVIETVTERFAKKNGNRFFIMHVTDGLQTADVTIWNDVYLGTDKRIFNQGVGIRLSVDYSEERKNFKIQTGSHIIPLKLREGEFQLEQIEEAVDIW